MYIFLIVILIVLIINKQLQIFFAEDVIEKIIKADNKYIDENKKYYIKLELAVLDLEQKLKKIIRENNNKE